ncbi:hypothetical protein [Mycetocola sp.]|uniref:hypothetical protein n=1 Tax=Mycetocola sp. TaxID=1871042 RepID=UPI003988A3F9
MPNRFRRPDPDRTPVRPAPPVPPGIAALLDSIDGEERELHSDGSGTAPAAPGALAFAQVLDDLTANLATDAPVLPRRLGRQPSVPQPLQAPGDLIVVIGAAVDALSVVRSMAAASAPVEIAVAGSIELPGTVRVDDRRSAVRARAIGVHNASPVFVAFGLDRRTMHRSNWEELVLGISPDQVWLAVDAGRKPDDTALWVHAVAARVPVDAVAVEGSALTGSPDTVEELNLPIGWVDGFAPAPTRPSRPIWDS